MWIDYILGLLSAIAMIVGGMYIGSRRELLWTLRDRAERAEAEQALRVEQGRLNERARIAREMHDVLAHRISLIAMHAGALAYRTDLTPAETRETAELIQTASHEALGDLREVLGVLRDGDADGCRTSARNRPSVTCRRWCWRPRAPACASSTTTACVEAAQMPDQVGRTAYRIVQEGLTNVRKHAPGVTIVVQMSGSPVDGLSIRIRNPARSRQLAVGGVQTPGAGLGLVGLGERAKLAGGSLDHPARRRLVRAHRVAAVEDVSAGGPIRVLVVDDDALVRSGLLMILGGAPDMEVVGEAVDGRDARRRGSPSTTRTSS